VVAVGAGEAVEVLLGAVVARLLAVRAADEHGAVAAHRGVATGGAARLAVAAAVRAGEARRVARGVEARAVEALQDARVARLHQVAVGAAVGVDAGRPARRAGAEAAVGVAVVGDAGLADRRAVEGLDAAVAARAGGGGALLPDVAVAAARVAAAGR